MYDIIFGDKTQHYTDLKDKFFGLKYAPDFDSVSKISSYNYVLGYMGRLAS